MENEPFYIYRPPTTSGKLEGTHFNPPQNEWKPSLSYKYRLQDIQNQFTPAESFRYTLATSGKHIRIVQRLERRWNKNYELFVHSAIKLQALYRGNVGREYFKSVRGKLLIHLREREALSTAKHFFFSGRHIECINTLDLINPMPIIMMSIKAKSFYRLKQFRECVATTKKILALEPLNEEAYYVQACAHAALKSYDAAYDTLKLLMIQVEDPCSDALRLFGFVATQMSPRLFEEAIDSFDTLVRRDNSDYHALLQRASCNACLQEWRLVVKDLNYILVFQPENIPALLLRARTYSCMREWQKATTDYNEVLKIRPQHSAAIAGLADMNHPLIELPMMSDEVMLNE